MLGRGRIHPDVFRQDQEFRAQMWAHIGRADKLSTMHRLRSQCRVRMTGGARVQHLTGYERPVNVKVRYHDRSGRHGPGMVLRLARYIEKDGPVFTALEERVKAADAVAGWQDDRRVFHVILSPNDGDKIADMRDFTRRYVTSLQSEVGALEWVASVEKKPDMAHPDGNHHVHLLVRGVRADQDLYFERRVIQERFRHHAVEIATSLLGYMSEAERRDYSQQLEYMAQERRRRKLEQEQAVEKRAARDLSADREVEP